MHARRRRRRRGASGWVATQRAMAQPYTLRRTRARAQCAWSLTSFVLRAWQSLEDASARLNAINKHRGNSPWNLSFSWSQALQVSPHTSRTQHHAGTLLTCALFFSLPLPLTDPADASRCRLSLRPPMAAAVIWEGRAEADLAPVSRCRCWSCARRTRLVRPCPLTKCRRFWWRSSRSQARLPAASSLPRQARVITFRSRIWSGRPENSARSRQILLLFCRIHLDARCRILLPAMPPAARAVFSPDAVNGQRQTAGVLV